jgi:hypothetical protein
MMGTLAVLLCGGFHRLRTVRPVTPTASVPIIVGLAGGRETSLCGVCPEKKRANMKRNVSDSEQEKLAKQLASLGGLDGKRLKER